MNERLIPLQFHLNGDAAGNGVAGIYIKPAFLLTDIGSFVTIAGGSVTVSTIDVQDDGTDAVVAHDISTDGITTLATQVRFEAGSVIELDLNLTGGTTPTVTGEITLWGYISE